MAEVKNFNFSGLAGVINTANAKADSQNLLDDLEGSIDAPSDYTMLNEELFGESESDSSGSGSISSMKSRKDERDDDEDDEDEDDEDDEDDSTSIEFNDPVTSGVKGVVNLGMTKSESIGKNHLEMLNNIDKK